MAQKLSEQKTWRCKCGAVELKLNGEPAVVFNCHCHSCVSCVRYIDEKAGGTNTSALSQEGPAGGAAKAMYYLENVEIPDGLVDKLNFIKVGEKGTAVRSYLKCCGTQLNTGSGRTFPAGFRPFNRNCIFNADGTRFQPKGPVQAVNAKSAFEPDLVPPPKHASAPCWLICFFVKGILKNKCCSCCCGSGAGNLRTEEAFWYDEKKVTEVVPITWEGNGSQEVELSPVKQQQM